MKKNMDNYYLEKIEELKKEFLNKYVKIMSYVLLLFIFIFYFFIINKFISFYLLFGLLFLSYSYFLAKEKYSANQILHTYMILAPLYSCCILITFWDNSITNFVTLFSLPLSAFVFFSRKEQIAYSLYFIFLIIICFLIHEYFNVLNIIYPRDEVIFLDTLIFAFNLIIIILLITYHKKINKLNTLYEVELEKLTLNESEKHNVPIIKVTQNKEKINEEIAQTLFEKLEDIMRNEEIFKNSKLDISALSSNLGVNYAYLSKIIRYKGYANFNTYLNRYRINYVKNLITQGGLQKFTLLHIYTAAGFSSQATFNRVFKQMEGITPSEYIVANSNSQENSKEVRKQS